MHVSWQLDRADRAQAALAWPTPAMPGPKRPATLADEVAALGRRLFWDPRGPGGLSDRAEATPGDAGRPFWSMRDRRPQRPAPPRQPAGGLGPRLCLAAGLAGPSCGRSWRKAGSGSRSTGSGRPHAGQAAAGRGRRQASDVDLPGLPGDGPRRPARIRRRDFGASWNTSGKRFLEQLDGRGAMSRMPADPEDGKAAMLELIDDEEVRLEELLTIHLEREEAAGERLAFDDSDSGRVAPTLSAHVQPDAAPHPGDPPQAPTGGGWWRLPRATGGPSDRPGPARGSGGDGPRSSSAGLCSARVS